MKITIQLTRAQAESAVRCIAHWRSNFAWAAVDERWTSAVEAQQAIERSMRARASRHEREDRQADRIRDLRSHVDDARTQLRAAKTEHDRKTWSAIIEGLRGQLTAVIERRGKI